MTKICRHCKKLLDEEHFHRAPKNKDGLTSWCKSCVYESGKKSRELNRDKIRAKDRERYHQNKEHFSNKNKAYFKAKPHKRLEYQFRKWAQELSLSEEEITDFYFNALKEQHGRCAICFRHVDELDHRLVIDHSHETNTMRGLLCRSCNVGIGNLHDDTNLCLNAAAYLSNHPSN